MTMTLSAARNEEIIQAGSFENSSMFENGEPVTLSDYLRTISRTGVRVAFGRDEVIYAEEEPADSIYRIINGTVRLCRYTADGRRHIVEFLLPGDLTGLLECADHPVTAEAVDEVHMIVYPRNAFDRLASAEPNIRRRVLCHLSSNILETQRHLFVISCQNAKERVASFLLRMADRMDVFQGQRLDLPMGRQDIADHLGLTVETVCRAITQLKDQGLIVVPNSGQVILKNVRGLQDMSLAH